MVRESGQVRVRAAAPLPVVLACNLKLPVSLAAARPGRARALMFDLAVQWHDFAVHWHPGHNQHLAMLHKAQPPPSQLQPPSPREMFGSVGADGKYVIDREEAVGLLGMIRGCSAGESEQDVDTIFELYDAEAKDGEIDYDEFKKVLSWTGSWISRCRISGHHDI